jgi:hypothetical protein
MSRPDNDELDGNLEDVARRLRSERPQASSLELDRMKTRAMARARSPRGRRAGMRPRIIVALLSIGLMVAGTSSVIASEGGGYSGGSGAAESQYIPPTCNYQKSACVCPHGAELGINYATQPPSITCICPSGSSWSSFGNSCEKPPTCPPSGNNWWNKWERNCEHAPPPPPREQPHCPQWCTPHCQPNTWQCYPGQGYYWNGGNWSWQGQGWCWNGNEWAWHR